MSIIVTGDTGFDYDQDYSKSPITSPPLGPYAQLPDSATGLKEWKVLLLVTAVNSFSQKVITYLRFLGFKHVSVQIASSDESMERACKGWNPDLVICPFLTRRIPETVFNNWVTLVVHPGPPGDAGPSSLDWVLLGDDGTITDSTQALDHLLTTSHESWTVKRRSHWGTIVFQANEHMDGGSVWAWEQYALPPIESGLTKAGLYQNQHSIAATNALITAMIRVYETYHSSDTVNKMTLRPLKQWEEQSVTHQCAFMGGVTLERPLITAKIRRPDFAIHTAEDVKRIVDASDSQPGAQLAPLTSSSKTSLFAYGSHLQFGLKTLPRTLYTCLGYDTWNDVPSGQIVATRSGAVLIKTKPSQSADGAIAAWITFGRVPKKVGSPLEPKIPMVDAIRASGHGSAVEGVQEWDINHFEDFEGDWKEVRVKTVVQDGKLAQFVYWDFYNGAFSTRQCELLLRACQWATAPQRGNVKILALMGGSYFSNGIALNTIEASADPGKETWDNINAIDDIVEFLLSDTQPARSAKLLGAWPQGAALCERGIITIACLKGNAAAGGVALAAGCDVTIAGRGVVLNPAYRAMGLHGSEFHSFSYLARCGQTVAANMLRDMLPQSSTDSFRTGLVDIEVGEATSSRAEIESLCVQQVCDILKSVKTATIRSAPWCRGVSAAGSSNSMIDVMCANKRAHYSARELPLVAYRYEELGQMLLDSFHPVRSKRYHERRYKFIRKVKSDATPSRYAKHLLEKKADEEELSSFDDAPGHVRGEEWSWVGMEVPETYEVSESTRIDLYAARRHSLYAPSISSVTSSATAIDQEIKSKVEELRALEKEIRRRSFHAGSFASTSTAGLPHGAQGEDRLSPLRAMLNLPTSTEDITEDLAETSISGLPTPSLLDAGNAFERRESTTSGSGFSIASSQVGDTSLASVESGPMPVTPPMESVIQTTGVFASPSSPSKEKVSQTTLDDSPTIITHGTPLARTRSKTRSTVNAHSGTGTVSRGSNPAYPTSTPTSPRRAAPGSPGTGKFRTFTRKMFGNMRSPKAVTNKRSSVVLSSTSRANAPFAAMFQDPTAQKQITAAPGVKAVGGSGPQKYVKPEVPNASDVEYPCLYDPEGKGASLQPATDKTPVVVSA